MKYRLNRLESFSLTRPRSSATLSHKWEKDYLGARLLRVFCDFSPEQSFSHLWERVAEERGRVREKRGHPRVKFHPVAILLLAIALFSPAAHAGEITVSSAASLKDALKEVGQLYQKSRPQTRVNFNFGSSGTLQKQIEQGAPVDVFVGASDANLNALLRQNLADKHANFGFARGELVLIGPRDSRLRGLSDVKSTRNFAIGGPGVPAGDYARQALKWYRLDKTVAPKLVYGKDVRGVLQLVASGNADAGLVYRTDALSSRQVKIVGALSPRSHAPIRYPMALLREAPNAREGRDFVRFCKGAAVKRVLRKYGFKA